MRKEIFKVNEQEFKLIQQIRNLKEKGFTDDDILQLDRSKRISKENIQKTRLDTMNINKGKIREAMRTVTHKRSQIESKTSLEVSKEFLDNKKPLYILETEVDALEYNVEQLKESNKYLQEEYDREEKK